MQVAQAASALVSILNAAAVDEVARHADGLASQVGLGDAARVRLARVVEGAGQHLLKHAGSGELFVGAAGDARRSGVQLLALDRGRGLGNGGDAASGPQTRGLRALQQTASTFDLYSAGDGTVLAATVYADGIEPLPVGGATVAAHGRLPSGDGWATWNAGALTSVFVCDGVGTGHDAAAASGAALSAFIQQAERSAQHVVESVHDALRGTRGASVALAELDYRTRTLRYCGLGGLGGSVLAPDGARQPLNAVTGIAGQVLRPLQVVTAPWTPGSVLVIHSNGLSRHWSLSRYPGLATRRADVIAGVLLRDHKQTREDATVVVACNPADA